MGATDKSSIVLQAALDANKRMEEAASCVTNTEKDDKIISTLPPHLRAARARLAMKLKTTTTVETSSVPLPFIESPVQDRAVSIATPTTEAMIKEPIPTKSASSGPSTAENTKEAKGITELNFTTSRAMKFTIVEDDDLRRATQRAKRAGAAAPVRSADDVWVRLDYKGDTGSEEQDWDMMEEFRTKQARKE
ncbi:hypothetical protein LTR10_001758 [Elasticomyces elasticus]|nr:hypothetical protein LTR10_001758 [Elasticomyces elasticus]KAK4975257.1 hypothetical protein LTR42_004467 [Elasticomyces elasticus]